MDGWYDDTNAAVTSSISKGEQRFVSLHTGGEMSFILNLLTMWETKLKKTGDYYDNVTVQHILSG